MAQPRRHLWHLVDTTLAACDAGIFVRYKRLLDGISQEDLYPASVCAYACARAMCVKPGSLLQGSWTCAQLQTGTSSIDTTRPTFSRTDTTWTASSQSCLQEITQYLRCAKALFTSAMSIVLDPALQRMYFVHQLATAQYVVTLTLTAVRQGLQP